MSDSLEYYTKMAPSAQAAVDIFKGEWSSKMPAGLETAPGAAELFQDRRITWAGEVFGGFEGKRVLELGPLEGGHSYMLQQAGAAQVVAVEANSKAFLKCLVVKEIFGLTKVEFLFGDFNRYLEQEERHFDIVVASGVLYHMTNPIRALNLISAATSNLMLWTHYFDQKLIDERGLSHFFEAPETRSYGGLTISLARKNYLDAVKWEGFCGGSQDHAYWLTRDSIFEALSQYGFKKTEIAFETPDHPHGPALALCATR